MNDKWPWKVKERIGALDHEVINRNIVPHHEGLRVGCHIYKYSVLKQVLDKLKYSPFGRIKIGLAWPGGTDTYTLSPEGILTRMRLHGTYGPKILRIRLEVAIQGYGWDIINTVTLKRSD